MPSSVPPIAQPPPLSPTTPPPTFKDKVLNVATMAVQNGGVAAAPLMNTIDPNANPHNLGGVEANLLALGLNAIAQPIKQLDWFDQNKWLPWVLLFVGLGIAFLLWHDDLAKAVLNGLASVHTALENYGHLNVVNPNILPSGTPTATDAARTAAQTAVVQPVPAIIEASPIKEGTT